MCCIIFNAPELYAQANCTTPPNCISNPGIDPPAGIPLYINGTPITNSTLPGWSVLSGTPVIGPGVVITNGFELVSDVTDGEGMVTCYNFMKDRTYKVCFRAYNTTTENRGSLILEAHDGSTDSQIIWRDVFYKSGPPHADNSHTFKANSNFTQLRIYTDDTTRPSNPYSVTLDDIGVIEVPDITASPLTIDGCGTTTLNTNSANPLTISWNPLGITTANNTPVVVTPCSTTTYIASYSTGCVLYGCNGNNNVSVKVTVQPGVTATASPSTILRCGSTTLTATSTNPMTVTWSPATGLNTTKGYIVTASPCRTTTYTATFTCGNCPPFTRKVTVYVQPNGSIADSSPHTCFGPIDLRYSSPAPCSNATYQWVSQKTGNVVATGPKWYKSSTAPGDIGIYMLIVTPRGCTPDTFYTSVIMDCCNVIADFDIIGCNPVRFVNRTMSNSDFALRGEWYWDFGDGTNSRIRNPSHSYITPTLGAHSVCLTAVIKDSTGATCCDKICKEVIDCDFMGCTPMAAFDYRITDQLNRDVRLIDRSSGNGNYACSWKWTVDGTVYMGDPTPVIPALGIGQHHICLEVGFCIPPNAATPCYEEWCEDIIIP